MKDKHTCANHDCADHDCPCGVEVGTPVPTNRLTLFYMYSDLTYKLCVWDNPDAELRKLVETCHEKFINVDGYTEEEDAALRKLDDLVNAYKPVELPNTGLFTLTTVVSGFCL